MAIDRELTVEEAAIVAGMTRYSWTDESDTYRALDLDGLAQIYAPDAISIPASHAALWGRDQIRDWYAGRTGDYEMNAVSEVDSIDIVGDVAVLVGIFRVTRRAEDGVAGLDHAGRWIAVMKKIDGKWLMWRDIDTPSPDANVLYHRLLPGR